MMEHKGALLDSLAELRAAHDKASRLMAEIAAIGAHALKGGERLPTSAQLHRYLQALAQVQRQARHCEDLLLYGPGLARPAEEAGARPHVH
jgi:hypothetical protein